MAALAALSALIVMSGTIAPFARADVAPDVSIWHAYGSSGTAEPAAFAGTLAAVQTRYPGTAISGDDRGFASLFGDFFGSATTGEPDLMVAPNDLLYWEWQSSLISDVRTTVLPRLLTMRPAAALGSIVDGHFAQIPESLKAIALYYDRDQLSRPPKTTGQFLASLEAGTKLGIIGHGAEAFYAYGFYGSFGGRILDREGRCVASETNGVARALAWLHEAVAAGLVVFPSAQEAADALIAGTVAGYLEGNWVFGDLRMAMGDRLGVVTGPSGPAGPFRSLVGVDGYVVNAASPDAAAVLAVARAMTDRSAQTTFMQVAGHVPADWTIPIGDARIRSFAQAAGEGVLRPMMAEFDAYWGPFSDAFNRVVYGSENARTVVAEACAAMNEANGR